jgi:diguanylate cyclase (GGDEF)-like protein
MHLGNQGIAFLPDGGPLPGGMYNVYANLEVDDNGAAIGEVHFASEPKYPPLVSIGTEFDLHVPHPNSILDDNVILKVRLVDDSGAITGYVIGSLAQFRPEARARGSSGENVEKDDLLPVLRRKVFDKDLVALSGAASEAEPVSLLMLDLDHFKAVNDTHGHPIGDEVLIECASTIARRCRHKGKVYRFGGEEIAVLLPNFTASEAVALAESIRCEIEASRMSSKKLSISASIGVATAPVHATEGKQLLGAADKALYAAKGRGRNLVRIAGGDPETRTGDVQRTVPEHSSGPSQHDIKPLTQQAAGEPKTQPADAQSGIDGEVYRLVKSPRVMEWEFVKQIYKASGRKDDPVVDTDILVEMYLVNKSADRTRYIREMRLSAEIDGERIPFVRQPDLLAEAVGDAKFEYGMRDRLETFQEPPRPLQQLGREFPLALAPEQPAEGWTRFMAKNINPDKVASGTIMLTVIDSVGTEYSIHKVPIERERRGEVSLRRLRD